MPLGADATGPERCRIARLEGTAVSLWREGRWRPARTGPLDPADAVLRTGPDSRAELTCPGGVVVTVGLDTEVNIEWLAASAVPSHNILVTVLRGIAGLVAPPPRPGPAALGGRLAMSAARSTEWLFVATATGAEAVFVQAGTVAVSATAGRAAAIVLGPGEGIDVTRPGTLGPVRVWGPARIAAARTALGLGWQ